MRRIADYEFLELLGEGNHGSFHLARTPDRLGVQQAFCAVKVLAQRASEDAFRRMVNELRLFAAVPSPHLVRLLDAGHQDGVLFYATAYHELGSLASPRAAARGQAAVLEAVGDAARAAHALHEAGVAHRDIKPTNVLLSVDGAVLSDLGLAQLLSPGATVTGVGPIGTLAFMEPGVARGEPASRASDVWSLGATLLAGLTGEGPYPEMPTDNLLRALRHLADARPRVPDRLPPGVRALIEDCLAPERGERPATALAVAERLDELTQEEMTGEA